MGFKIFLLHAPDLPSRDKLTVKSVAARRAKFGRVLNSMVLRGPN